MSIGTGEVIGTYVTHNRAHDRSGNITEYSYDRMGNVTKRTTKGTTTRYTYDHIGQLIEEILPNGNGTKYAYDDRGNKTIIRKKSDMSQTDNDATDIVIHMSYTGVINTIESIEDSRGAVTTFESDAHGNITKIIKNATADTLETVESFVYDTFGHLIEKTDVRGIHTIYVYNGAGKISQTTQ